MVFYFFSLSRSVLMVLLLVLLFGCTLSGCVAPHTEEDSLSELQGTEDSTTQDLLKEEEIITVSEEENAKDNGKTTDTVSEDSYSTYQINYDGTGIPLSDLPIGSRIVDPSWEWEFRLGDNYSNQDWLGEPAGPGEVKPVTWILVAKDHYAGLDHHVTLLTEELIAFYVFDNSNDRREAYDPYDSGGHNHWGKSGTTNAKNGLRPWLNSNGIHNGEGFYRAFSDNFKNSILGNTLPNWDFESRGAYYTEDRVFIPSSTELGDKDHLFTYPIGKTYPYFSGAPANKLASSLGGINQSYWTRSPQSFCAYEDEEYLEECEDYPGTLTGVDEYGEFTYLGADYNNALRPSLNLKAGIMTVEITD